MADLDTYEADPRGNYDDRDYGRDRSRSPGPDRDGDTRIRDDGLNGRDRDGHQNGAEEESSNPGSNLFVTGIHPRLSEEEVAALFEKYGTVEKCNIMRDPHTRESRGFGFVKMQDTTAADAAKEGLQGEQYEGRTLSIEKARRARPRTPTPGKYFGPPKRGPGGRPDFREGGYSDRSYRGGGYRERYDDRGGYGRRDDYRRGGGYRDRYDDRGSRGYDDRGSGGYGGRSNDYDAPRGDRYGSSRDDRYGDRRGGGGGGGYGYDRPSRGAGDAAGASSAAPARGYDDDRRRYD